MELHTERLWLSEFVLEDLEAIYAYESDSAVVEYVCYGPSTRAECRQELDFRIGNEYNEKA